MTHVQLMILLTMAVAAVVLAAVVFLLFVILSIQAQTGRRYFDD